MHGIGAKIHSVNLKFIGRGSHRFSQKENSHGKHSQAFAENLSSRIHFTKGKCYQDKIYWLMKSFWFKSSQELIILWFNYLYFQNFQLSDSFFGCSACTEVHLPHRNVKGITRKSWCMEILVHSTPVILYSFESQSLTNLCRFEKIKHGFY